MIKKNSYSINKKYYFLIISLFASSFFWLLISIDYKKIIKTEIQSFQTHFVSFSNVTQLFDSGDIKDSTRIKFKDILPGVKQFIFVLSNGFFTKNNKDFPEIKLFIKFKNLNKIYDDRNRAVSLGLNYNSQYVPCKISDGIKFLKCKVKLKGDLEDHWDTKVRFSMRIKVKNGYIHGLQNFSIQKPTTRQFPYDQSFAQIHSDLGGLANNDQRFYNIKINDEYWGLMNIEPNIDDKFIESRHIKRSGVFRISNQDNWVYLNDNNLIENHFISDPTIFFSQRGKEAKILKNKNSREIYSYIFHSLNSKNPNIFDRKKMVDSFMNAMVWGNLHSLFNYNSFYTWNAYTQKLEPILTDQGNWQKIDETAKKDKKLTKLSDVLELEAGLPYEYKIIFQNFPLSKKEYTNSLKKIDDYFKINDPLITINKISNKYFPNNRVIKNSPIQNNIKFLMNNSDKIILWTQDLSKNKNTKKTKLNYELFNKIALNKAFLKIIHFTDGTIQIYNLLNEAILISSITSGTQYIKVNKIIPASKKNLLSKIEIKTSLIGEYDQKIKVTTNFNNFTKFFYNDFSIMNNNYFTDTKTASPDILCKISSMKELCYISGKHKISNNIIFKKKVVISKGTELILSNKTNLIFKKSVKMDGTKNDPISISGNGSIAIFNSTNSNSTSIINYVNFDNLITPSIPLMRFTGSINVHGGKINISNSKISNGSSEDQLNIVNSDINVSNLTFNNAISDAFDCDYCRGKMSNLSFFNIGGDGLDISGSNMTLSSATFNSINDKAISIGENSILNMKDIFIEKAGTGIAVKDGSKVEVLNISMKKILYDGFMTYVKKPYFKDVTQLHVKNIDEFEGNLCVRQKNTIAMIEGENCEESTVDVINLYKEGRMKK